MNVAAVETHYQVAHRAPSTIEEDILDHDIIISLIGEPDPKVAEEPGFASVNIFDVFLDIFMCSKHDRVLLKSLLDELSAFVTEYCTQLTDSTPSMKRAYCNIMTKIFEKSSLANATISDEDRCYFNDILIEPARIG